MKPVETIYKGLRFRSRLEARWAVFFDALGLRWEYEQRGPFDVGKAGWYLPDFWLPEIDTEGAWVEIKPSKTGNPQREWCDDPKWNAFAMALREEDGPIQTYCIIGEPPDPPTIDMWGARNITILGDVDYSFCVCPVCGKIGIEYEARSGRIPCNCEVYEECDTGDNPRLVAAYKAARQARFEHGERGYR